MAIQTKIQEYAKAINLSWHKTTDNVLETARLCADVEKKFHSDDKDKLFKDLDFNKATFSKLAKIGSKQYLLAADVKLLLPPNYTVIYQIAGLSENELQLAIKDGVISPDMTRADLEAWNAERKGGDTAKKDEKAPIIATIRVPADYDDDKKAQLEEALKKLKSDFGMAVECPGDPEAEAFKRMVEEVDDYIRKGARQYLRKLKAKRFAGKSRLTKAQRNRLWNYGDDEVEIRSDELGSRFNMPLIRSGAWISLSDYEMRRSGFTACHRRR